MANISKSLIIYAGLYSTTQYYKIKILRTLSRSGTIDIGACLFQNKHHLVGTVWLGIICSINTTPHLILAISHPSDAYFASLIF